MNDPVTIACSPNLSPRCAIFTTFVSYIASGFFGPPVRGLLRVVCNSRDFDARFLIVSVSFCLGDAIFGWVSGGSTELTRDSTAAFSRNSPVGLRLGGEGAEAALHPADFGLVALLDSPTEDSGKVLSLLDSSILLGVNVRWGWRLLGPLVLRTRLLRFNLPGNLPSAWSVDDCEILLAPTGLDEAGGNSGVLSTSSALISSFIKPGGDLPMVDSGVTSGFRRTLLPSDLDSPIWPAPTGSLDGRAGSEVLLGVGPQSVFFGWRCGYPTPRLWKT